MNLKRATLNIFLSSALIAASYLSLWTSVAVGLPGEGAPMTRRPSTGGSKPGGSSGSGGAAGRVLHPLTNQSVDPGRSQNNSAEPAPPAAANPSVDSGGLDGNGGRTNPQVSGNRVQNAPTDQPPQSIAKIAEQIYDMTTEKSGEEKLERDFFYKFIIGSTSQDPVAMPISTEEKKRFQDLKRDLLADFVNNVDLQALVSVAPELANTLASMRETSQKDPQIGFADSLVNKLLRDPVMADLATVAFQGNRHTWTFLTVGPAPSTSPNPTAQSAPDFKIYVNINPGNIPALAKLILASKELVDPQLKLIDFSNPDLPPHDRSRSEKLVVYVNEAQLPMALRIVQQFLESNPSTTGPTPLFTQEVVAGVAIAQESRDPRKSFSELRAELLQNVTIAVVDRLLKTPDDPYKLTDIFIRAVDDTTEGDPEDRAALINALTDPDASDSDKRDVRVTIKTFLPEFLRMIPKEVFIEIALRAYKSEAETLGISPENPARNHK